MSTTIWYLGQSLGVDFCSIATEQSIHPIQTYNCCKESGADQICLVSAVKQAGNWNEAEQTSLFDDETLINLSNHSPLTLSSEDATGQLGIWEIEYGFCTDLNGDFTCDGDVSTSTTTLDIRYPCEDLTVTTVPEYFDDGSMHMNFHDFGKLLRQETQTWLYMTSSVEAVLQYGKTSTEHLAFVDYYDSQNGGVNPCPDVQYNLGVNFYTDVDGIESTPTVAEVPVELEVVVTGTNLIFAPTLSTPSGVYDLDLFLDNGVSQTLISNSGTLLQLEVKNPCKPSSFDIDDWFTLVAEQHTWQGTQDSTTTDWTFKQTDITSPAALASPTAHTTEFYCFQDGKMGFKMNSLIDSSSQPVSFDDSVYGGQVGTQVAVNAPDMPFQVTGTNLHFEPLSAHHQAGEYVIELRWYYVNIDYNYEGGGGTGCTDISGVSDGIGQECSVYTTSMCGQEDTVSFTSSTLCCACGGGTIKPALPSGSCTDTVTSPAVDDNGNTCADLTQAVGCSDTNMSTNFQQMHVCCTCGGGTRYDTYQNVNAFEVIGTVTFTVIASGGSPSSPSSPSDVIRLVGSNPAEIDFCAISITATGMSDCGSSGSFTSIDTEVLTGQLAPDMTRFTTPASTSKLITDYVQMTATSRIDSVGNELVSYPLVDIFNDDTADTETKYGWWTIKFTYCHDQSTCDAEVSLKLLLFNPCRAIEFTPDPSSLFFSSGYIANYEDFVGIDLPGDFIIFDQMTTNKAEIYYDELLAQDNECPLLTVTRIIRPEYTDTNGATAFLAGPSIIALDSIFQTDIDLNEEPIFKFNYNTLDAPYGIFTVDTIIEQLTTFPGSTAVVEIQTQSFNIEIRQSCKVSHLHFVDNTPAQTLSTLNQIGYYDLTSLEWELINTVGGNLMPNLQLSRTYPSYSGECPSNVRLFLHLKSAVNSDGDDLTVSTTPQASEVSTEAAILFPSDEPNMPVRISGGNIVFEPKATDEAGTYMYCIGYDQYSNDLSEISSILSSDMMFSVSEATSYPGTQGAQLFCEGYSITEADCNIMYECCNWNSDKCYSSVGQSECTITDVWTAAKDKFTEQFFGHLITLADGFPHEVILSVIGYINEQNAYYPDLALSIDILTASGFTDYAIDSDEGVLTFNPTDMHVSPISYQVEGTLTNGEETYLRSMNVLVNYVAPTYFTYPTYPISPTCSSPPCNVSEPCIDSDYGAQDVNGFGCEKRNQDINYCGKDDDMYFDSMLMCCICQTSQTTQTPSEETPEMIEPSVESVTDSPPEQRQAAFDELLKYNVQYLQSLQKEGDDAEAPDLQVTNLDSSGRFIVIFNAELAGPSFIEALSGQLQGQGFIADDSQTNWRQLNESSGQNNSTDTEEVVSFDVASYLLFEIVRGSENSAPHSQLNFTINSTEIEGNSMHFKAIFDNPLDVSTGDQKDQLTISVNNTAFFMNKITGVPIAENTVAYLILPKMLANAEMVAIMDTSQQVVEKAGQTILVAQLIITAFLAISLKSMWNLMNVIQVLSYMRFYTDWPAFMIDILVYFDNAITLKPISDLIFNFGKDKFEIAGQKLSDEALRNSGVRDVELFKSLGVFTLIIVVLLIGVLLYFILKLCKGEKVTLVKNKLHEKLFYNGFLRYMTVSNLKLNYTVWGFMIVYWNALNLVNAGVCGVILCFIVLYPGLVIVGLLKNHHRIEEEKFKTAFNSLFNGIQTRSKQALIYEAIFCIRRFFIVFVNISLSSNVPLNNFVKHRYLFKILIFIGIQSIYLWYVNDTRPHTDKIFTRLEFFNEGSLMFLAYIMIAYTDVMPYNASKSILAGVMSVAVVILIASANLFVLGYLSFTKLRNKCENDKAKKHSAESTQPNELTQRLKVLKKQQPARNGSSTLAIVQEIEEEKEDCKVEDYSQDLEVFYKDPRLKVSRTTLKINERIQGYERQKTKAIMMRSETQRAVQQVEPDVPIGVFKLRELVKELKEFNRQEKRERRTKTESRKDINDLNLLRKRTIRDVEDKRELIGDEMADAMLEQIEKQYTLKIKTLRTSKNSSRTLDSTQTR